MPAPHLPSPEALYPFAVAVGRIVAILAGALVLSKFGERAIRALRGRFLAVMNRRAQAPSQELDKRAATVSEIFAKTIAVVIWVGALMMALKEAGFDVRPLLAGAGIVGLAVGFGAQSLVRDIITGLSILIENQIRIGDVAVINGTQGVVEELNLRTTVLRGIDGTVHIFHNGAINTLSNMTREYAYYVFNVRVGQKEDSDRVGDALRQVGEELRGEEAYKRDVLEPIEVLGVDQFIDGGYVVQARVKTLPMRQWAVGREMNRRIKKRFDELGIQMR